MKIYLGRRRLIIYVRLWHLKYHCLSTSQLMFHKTYKRCSTKLTVCLYLIMVVIRGAQRPLQILNDFQSFKNILKADFMTPSSYMFEILGWQTIPKRLLYTKSVLVYKALNNLTPTYITNLLTPVSQTHPRSLRSSENCLLSIHRSWSALFDRSFSYSASKLWNVLPLNLKTASSLNEFKSWLRNYLVRH